jgi:hypothetical protein
MEVEIRERSNRKINSFFITRSDLKGARAPNLGLMHSDSESVCGLER